MTTLPKGGCLLYCLGGVAASVAACYLALKLTQLFVPRDEILQAQIALFAGVDAMALAALAFASHISPAACREQNTAIRVGIGFSALGALCGRGNGLLFLGAVAAINLLLGLVAWWLIIRPIPDPRVNGKSK